MWNKCLELELLSTRFVKVEFLLFFFNENNLQNNIKHIKQQFKKIAYYSILSSRKIKDNVVGTKY